MNVKCWLGEMGHVFLYYFADQAGDCDSPEFVRVSLCLGFLGNGYGEADLHIIREFLHW